LLRHALPAPWQLRRGGRAHRARSAHFAQVHPGRKKRIEPPGTTGYSSGMEDLAIKARSYLDGRRGERVTLEELSQAGGASPFHLQRRFKQAFGVSPRGYQEAHRVESVKSSLRNGSGITDAVYAAGYGSVSRFYEKPPLGMTARDYRAQGKGQTIRYSCFATPLGTV